MKYIKDGLKGISNILNQIQALGVLKYVFIIWFQKSSGQNKSNHDLRYLDLS